MCPRASRPTKSAPSQRGPGHRVTRSGPSALRLGVTLSGRRDGFPADARLLGRLYARWCRRGVRSRPDQGPTLTSRSSAPPVTIGSPPSLSACGIVPVVPFSTLRSVGWGWLAVKITPCGDHPLGRLLSRVGHVQALVGAVCGQRLLHLTMPHLLPRLPLPLVPCPPLTSLSCACGTRSLS